jgi:HK97 family phage major capsid protein
MTSTPDDMFDQAQRMLDATADNPAAFDEDAYEALVDRAERASKLDRIRRAAAHPGSIERAYHAPGVIIRKDPFENVDLVRESAGELRDRAMHYSENREHTRELEDEQREVLQAKIERVPGAAAHVLAHGSPIYRQAFNSWLKAEGSPMYTQAEADAVRTALNITTGASGQYTLPTVFDPTLIHTGNAAINPVRAVARVETGTQNVWHGVSTGNVTTYWHAEAAALTDGSPTLSNPIVTAGHLTGYVMGSWEFFDDSPMVAQLPGLIAEAMDFAEATAFISGTGTSQPLGVVTAISATAGSTVTATTRGSFTSASSADIFAVANAVAPRYEARSVWFGNKKYWNVVRQMSSAGYGSLFWGNMTNSVTPQPDYPLLGYNTYNSSDMATTTTTGTVLLILGDFSQYLIYDRLGSTAEVLTNVVNSSGLPTGQRGLAIRKRTGGNVTDINAFRFLYT